MGNLSKNFININADGLGVNVFIQNLIDTVAKIREKQIQNGVVDNKIMIYNHNNSKEITIQYYDYNN